MQCSSKWRKWRQIPICEVDLEVRLPCDSQVVRCHLVRLPFAAWCVTLCRSSATPSSSQHWIFVFTWSSFCWVQNSCFAGVLTEWQCWLLSKSDPNGVICEACEHCCRCEQDQSQGKHVRRPPDNIEMRMITRCPGEREANIMTNDIGLLRKDDLWFATCPLAGSSIFRRWGTNKPAV